SPTLPRLRNSRESPRKISRTLQKAPLPLNSRDRMTTAPEIKIRMGNEKLVKVTDNAGTKLTSLLTRQGRPQGALRVAVIGGGCSGLQYKMDLVDGPANRDIMVESAGVRVLV